MENINASNLYSSVVNDAVFYYMTNDELFDFFIWLIPQLLVTVEEIEWATNLEWNIVILQMKQ